MANARLIAAAPELLAQLKEVLRCDENHDDLFLEDCAFRKELEELVAKAEGK